MSVIVIYILQSSDFTLYLEDYLIDFNFHVTRWLT